MDAPPTLPDLGGDDGGGEIVPENIRAVAVIYAACQLEKAGLFAVVDRIVETFMNGTLPVDNDAGGRVLDVCYRDSSRRVTTKARRALYARVLGAPGGEVSDEVTPNAEFNELFVRFLSALVEYGRQRRTAGGSSEHSPPRTSEHLRKAGRDVAINATAHGRTSVHDAARRLNDHIEQALQIVETPAIQAGYGVNTAWHLFERVAASDLGVPSDIVRCGTMAESGRAILDFVAANRSLWPPDSELEPFVNAPEAENELVGKAERWLAVVAGDSVLPSGRNS
jgi:hypothetical protein